MIAFFLLILFLTLLPTVAHAHGIESIAYPLDLIICVPFILALLMLSRSLPLKWILLLVSLFVVCHGLGWLIVFRPGTTTLLSELGPSAPFYGFFVIVYAIPIAVTILTRRKLVKLNSTAHQ